MNGIFNKLGDGFVVAFSHGTKILLLFGIKAGDNSVNRSAVAGRTRDRDVFLKLLFHCGKILHF